MHLEVTEDAKALLARKGWDPQFGARPLRRAIQREVEDELAEELLKGNFATGDRILAELNPDNPDKLKFSKIPLLDPLRPRRLRRHKRSDSARNGRDRDRRFGDAARNLAVSPARDDRAWFARDLVRRGLDSSSRAASCRAQRRGWAASKSTVFDPPGTARAVGIEWGGGTGPLALRAGLLLTAAAASVRTSSRRWRPFVRRRRSHRPRTTRRSTGCRSRSPAANRGARAASGPSSRSPTAGALSASLVLDSPRLRGAAPRCRRRSRT